MKQPSEEARREADRRAAWKAGQEIANEERRQSANRRARDSRYEDDRDWPDDEDDDE